MQQRDFHWQLRKGFPISQRELREWRGSNRARPLSYRSPSSCVYFRENFVQRKQKTRFLSQFRRARIWAASIYLLFINCQFCWLLHMHNMLHGKRQGLLACKLAVKSSSLHWNPTFCICKNVFLEMVKLWQRAWRVFQCQEEATFILRKLIASINKCWRQSLNEGFSCFFLTNVTYFKVKIA